VLAWYWHVAARTLMGVLSGTLFGPPSERGLGRRILLFSSVGVVSAFAGEPREKMPAR
jgi:hypothetical protein